MQPTLQWWVTRSSKFTAYEHPRMQCVSNFHLPLYTGEGYNPWWFQLYNIQCPEGFFLHLAMQDFNMACIGSPYVHLFVTLFVFCHTFHVGIRESVDSLCRDGANMPIVHVHWKTYSTCQGSHSKFFWAPSYPIPIFPYPTTPTN